MSAPGSFNPPCCAGVLPLLPETRFAARTPAEQKKRWIRGAHVTGECVRERLCQPLGCSCVCWKLCKQLSLPFSVQFCSEGPGESRGEHGRLGELAACFAGRVVREPPTPLPLSPCRHVLFCSFWGPWFRHKGIRAQLMPHRSHSPATFRTLRR